MKRKQIALGLAALIVAGGLWLSRSTGRSPAAQNLSADVGAKTTNGRSEPGQTGNHRPRLEPPNPTRRFTDFTPEQRVEFARKGHGPGG